MPRPTSRASRDAVLASCTRYVVGDGPRRAENLLAMIPADTAMDHYGQGGVVAELEAEVAALLGKPAALFLVSGTMAQQATLRVHADRRASRAIAFHPLCHLEIHEERAYQRLHGLFGVPVGSRHEPLTAAELAELAEPVAALVVELPQRELGGTLPDWDELVAQCQWARERGAAVHLDGARLWECAPFYERSRHQSLADVAALFDTVYVSFYKGLGGIAGCCVVGEADVIAELSIWRTRHGGRPYMLWPYAAAALTALRERRGDMARYVRHAQAIARALRHVEGVEVIPEQVRTPMMHLRLSATAAEIDRRAMTIARERAISTFVRPGVSEGPRLQRYELAVGRATVDFTPAEVAALIGELVGARPRPRRAPARPSRARP